MAEKGSFKSMNNQPLEVSIDADPYRLENGEDVRVVMQGEDFFFNLSPRVAISVGIELIRCAYFEMELEKNHLKKSAEPTDREPKKD